MTKQIFYLELNKDKRHKEMKKCLTNMLKNFNHTV